MTETIDADKSNLTLQPGDVFELVALRKGRPVTTHAVELRAKVRAALMERPWKPTPLSRHLLPGVEQKRACAQIQHALSMLRKEGVQIEHGATGVYRIKPLAPAPVPPMRLKENEVPEFDADPFDTAVLDVLSEASEPLPASRIAARLHNVTELDVLEALHRLRYLGLGVVEDKYGWRAIKAVESAPVHKISIDPAMEKAVTDRLLQSTEPVPAHELRDLCPNPKLMHPRQGSQARLAGILNSLHEQGHRVLWDHGKKTVRIEPKTDTTTELTTPRKPSALDKQRILDTLRVNYHGSRPPASFDTLLRLCDATTDAFVLEAIVQLCAEGHSISYSGANRTAWLNSQNTDTTDKLAGTNVQRIGVTDMLTAVPLVPSPKATRYSWSDAPARVLEILNHRCGEWVGFDTLEREFDPTPAPFIRLHMILDTLISEGQAIEIHAVHEAARVSISANTISVIQASKAPSIYDFGRILAAVNTLPPDLTVAELTRGVAPAMTCEEWAEVLRTTILTLATTPRE